MAIAAEAPRADTDIAPAARRPGEFARHPRTGAPYVVDPTTLVDARLTLAELIELCARHGIDWRSDLDIDPGRKPTTSQLKGLLGDLAKRGRRTQYGRPSALGKQIENMTNVQKWSERAVALGLWLDFVAAAENVDRPELLGQLDDLDESKWTLDDPDVRDLLDAIAVRAKNLAQAGLAADRGTHVHERTEDHDEERDWIEAANRGEELGLPVEAQAALVAAWSKMLTEHDIEILAVEARCVDDVWRQAGTLDRICRLRRDTTFIAASGEFVTLPAGWVGILDIKTGRLRLGDDGFVAYWHGYAVQLASYAQSARYDPDTDTRTEWEWPIDQRWAIIAHLDVLAALDGEAKCRLVLVDLEAGRHAGALCVAAREWERRRDVFSIPTDDLTVTVPVAATPTPPAASQPATEASPPSVAPIATPADTAEQAGQQAEGTADPSATSAGQDGTPQPSPKPDRPAADGMAAESVPSAATPDRRTQLLARYNALHRDDKLRFTDLGLDMGDLDAVERGLNAIEASALIVTETVRRIVIARELATTNTNGWDGPTFTGDEGDLVSEGMCEDMIAALRQLPPATIDTLEDIVGEAYRTVGSISLRPHSGRRRWEIYRAFVNLGRFGWDDELVRAALVTVTGDETAADPAISLGVVVGMLGLDQAIAFADLAARIELGAVIPDASTGRWTWTPAA